MAEDNFHIRTMTEKELEIAVEWAALEGWNPGIHDAECFYGVDPSGYFMGFLDGEPVGSISAVSYGESYGFMGFYIVRPEYRGQGFGLQLWNRAIEYLEGHNIGLDGVPAQQDNYKRSGFRLAYGNIRNQWLSRPIKDPRHDLVQLSELSQEELAQYDSEIFGVPRESFLKCWISRPQSTALGVVEDGRLAGYGVIRQCRKGFKVGPLFADGPDLAEALFLGLTADMEAGTPVFLDTPEVNLDAVKLAKSYGMTKVFETARMYSSEEPAGPIGKWFGVTTFELG
ncbi:GNAT family N-acetyltransferase [Thermodesulfobacteriota bacterium]